MKRADLYFALVVAAFFVPFFLSRTLYEGYQSFNAAHGMVMSFVKFSILSTMGELLGLRISSGHYFRKGFGVLPRAVVWGVPAFAAYLGVDNPAAIMEGAFSWGKVLLAFAISVTMNSIFAPVFMTFHKITDTHILMTGGTLRGLFSPIPMGEIMQRLNWRVQWEFVFKKTIPLFWFPAHTVTFLLPGEVRVLFAALLGVALGVILAVAARKK